MRACVIAISNRVSTDGVAGGVRPSSSARAWAKIHGWPKEPRAIITASQPVSMRMRYASCGVLMSPFPMTGIDRAAFTAAISSQCAWPEYICVRVRGCSARTRAPASWQRSAIVTGSRISSFQPLRIFTVTGRCVLRDTARITDCTRSRSRRHPDPPLRRTTFFTGQPKLMSTKSGRKMSVTSFAASPIASGSAPKICTPIGCSSGSKRSLAMVASFSRRIPSAERNSVTTTSAPCARQRRRNGDSETPAMGARISGTACAAGYGNSMS